MASSNDYVLFVEDSADDVDLTLLSFREIDFPYQVVVVRDGAETLEFLFGTGRHAERDKRKAPALVILDLNLPKVHGLDVLRRLKADPVLRNVLVVILTSSEEHREEAQKIGVNLYIQKPVDFDDFPGVVEQISRLMEALPVRA